MALGKHFEQDEALAVLKLTSQPEWKQLQVYLERRFIQEARECIAHKEPHMIYRSQGAATVFDEMGKLGNKAKNFLEGA
jgi:hypothetical protein